MLMANIKIFDLALTAVAFAALFFLLPPDRDTKTVNIDQPYPSSSVDGTAKINHQPVVRGHFLHKA